MAAASFSPLLHGETILFSYEKVKYVPFAGDVAAGRLRVTNYQIEFVDDSTQWMVQFPLGSVAKMETQEERGEIRVNFMFRDFRYERFVLPPDALKLISSKLSKKLFPKSASDLFAFKHHAQKKDDGDVFTPSEEYMKRMKVMDKVWTLKTVNETYDLCRSYPRHFYVPATIKDTDLWRVAIYRGDGRIPILSWRKDKVLLARASRPNPLLLQDMVGMTPVRNESDLRLIEEFYSASGSEVMVIINLKDSEDKNIPNPVTEVIDEGYPNCDLITMNVASPKVVTQYYQFIQKSCTEKFQNLEDLRSKLNESKWTDCVEELLEVAYVSAAHITNMESVLVQSRDGDDMCAQVTCLTQLLVDPFYRTLRGFSVLIEKEWVFAGHRFCEFLKVAKMEEEHFYAATWVQFVDAVWQLLRAHPRYFEFNEDFLLFLVDCVYSCRFGTFLCAHL